MTLVGGIILASCTIFLAIASYLNIPMWIIALGFAILLLIIITIYDIVKKHKIIFQTFKRLPWNLIPFIISMFIIVTSLDKSGIIKEVALFMDRFSINKTTTVLSYGLGSFISCNILNNIPMSVMFERIIAESSQSFFLEKIYSVIIASNIGAYFSPIGALAGIMWMSILNKAGFKFNFKKFIKYGSIISPVILLISLGILILIL